MTRDQERAVYAYACVEQVAGPERGDYEILVKDLGAQVLRSGLAAAMAFLERERRRAATPSLLAHLAGAGIPALHVEEADQLPGRVRELNLGDYMLATRELLKVVTWLKRAVQATFDD